MVRLDKCVEALYDNGSSDGRTKNLQILTVMKGAISMSRSKTGECIFRTNKTEKKNLERLLKIEGRTSNYNISQIDTNRKHVMSRWSKVLENQASCSSQALFEELLEIDDVNDASKGGLTMNRDTPDPKDYKLKNLVDLRLAKLDSENNTNGFSSVMASRRRHFNTEYQELEQSADENNEATQSEFITERKQIRNKYVVDPSQQEAIITSDELGTKAHGVVLATNKSVQLPVIHAESGSAPPRTKASDIKPSTLERDLTDWGNWDLKDKSWIVGYLHREKTKHEDLIIRNALNKIETEMSGSNIIKRQQFRQKLQNERQQREAEVRRNERLKREAEMTRTPGDIKVVSPEKLESPSACQSPACTSPILKKRVAFKEMLTNSEDNSGNVEEKRTKKSAVRSYRTTKRQHKPIDTTRSSLSSCSLPMINEGKVAL